MDIESNNSGIEQQVFIAFLYSAASESVMGLPYVTITRGRKLSRTHSPYHWWVVRISYTEVTGTYCCKVLRVKVLRYFHTWRSQEDASCHTHTHPIPDDRDVYPTQKWRVRIFVQCCEKKCYGTSTRDYHERAQAVTHTLTLPLMSGTYILYRSDGHVLL